MTATPGILVQDLKDVGFEAVSCEEVSYSLQVYCVYEHTYNICTYVPMYVRMILCMYRWFLVQKCLAGMLCMCALAMLCICI